MSEPASTTQRTKLRIENLSDLVFGLALSIGSIILISKLPQTPYALVSGIALFGFSFLIIIWIWSGYTRTMADLLFEVRGTFVLNIVLLFCVAIEPYLFYVLQAGAFALLEFASSVYAIDVGAMMFILAGLIYLVRGEEKRRTAHSFSITRAQRLRRVMLAEIAAGVVFFTSALPYFWIPVFIGRFARFDMWYASLAVFALLTLL